MRNPASYYEPKESAIERTVYANGTGISFEQFIAYRDACDEERADAEQLQADFDQAAQNVARLESELEDLKTKGFTVYTKLGDIDVDNYSKESLVEILNELAAELHEVVK